MTVVVGYVDSTEGRSALSAASDEAQRRGGDLVVVPLSVDDSTKDLQRLVDGLPVPAQINPASGADVDKTERLLQVAEQSGAELLVIGLRRRSTVGKLILGSHAQRVLLGATCPVLTVTTDES